MWLFFFFNHEKIKKIPTCQSKCFHSWLFFHIIFVALFPSSNYFDHTISCHPEYVFLIAKRADISLYEWQHLVSLRFQNHDLFKSMLIIRSVHLQVFLSIFFFNLTIEFFNSTCSVMDFNYHVSTLCRKTEERSDSKNYFFLHFIPIELGNNKRWSFPLDLVSDPFRDISTEMLETTVLREELQAGTCRENKASVIRES